jgi:hypothetical protein
LMPVNSRANKAHCVGGGSPSATEGGAAVLAKRGPMAAGSLAQAVSANVAAMLIPNLHMGVNLTDLKQKVERETSHS